MARGDGIHRTSARNMRLTTPKLKNAQQHNEREKESYVNQDIVPERSHLNVTYCQENIKAVYHELFDEALERYNAKQTRADRRIENYYEKIRSGKQEKPFHEIILQVGNKDDMSADSDEGRLAAAVRGAWSWYCSSTSPSYSQRTYTSPARPEGARV